MTKEMINAALLGLFAASGPVAKMLALWLKLDDQSVHIILDMCTILTPSVAGGIFTYLQRPSNIVASVAAMPAAAQQAALTHTTDAAKVQVAEAVPGVATVVIKDTENGSALGKLA